MLFYLFLCFLEGLLSYLFSWWILILTLPTLFIVWKRGSKKLALLGALLVIAGITISLLVYLPKVSDTLSSIGFVSKTGENYYVFTTFKGSFYVYSKGHQMNLFDVLKIEGKVSNLAFTSYEGRFSFEEYLNNLGILKEIDVYENKTVIRSFLNLRAYQSWTVSQLGEQQALGLALLFFKTPYDWKAGQGIERMGLITVLFSAGVHVSGLVGALRKLLERKYGDLKASVIVLPICLFFVITSGFSFTSLRIFLTSLLWMFVRWKKIKWDGLDVQSSSFLILLFFFPGYCLEESFWYPFLLSLSIRLADPFVRKRTGFRKSLSSLFSRSFVIVPLGLYTKGVYGIFGIFLSPFVTSLGTVLFIVSLPLYFLPVYGLVFKYVLFASDKLFGGIGVFDGIYLNGGFPLWLLAIYFGLGAFVSFAKVMNFKKVVPGSLFLMSVVLISPSLNALLPKTEVHFINVGQGSATLIRNGRNSILVDTGGSLYFDMAEECLIPYFEKIGVRSLDAVLLTHGDNDHDGALSSLISLFPVSIYMYGKDTPEFFSYGNIEFINYNHGTVSEDENDSSGVFGFELNSISFLIMGDASVSVEKKILQDYPKIDTDVLLVGHHGSKTSSSKDFLAAVSPKLAVISVGKGNWYGHPSKTVLDTLTSLSIPYHRTDLNGTLVYKP